MRVSDTKVDAMQPDRFVSLRSKGMFNAYLLLSMLFPRLLALSFRRAAGPILARWSALGDVMMVSQMTAWFDMLVVPWPVETSPDTDGHCAVT